MEYNPIIYLWVVHGTPNSFCSKSYYHLKLTQLHFPLTVCKFSTYGPCWSFVALVREWVKGVLIDGHVIRTLSQFVIQDLTDSSGLKFLGVSDPIDGCAGRIMG